MSDRLNKYENVALFQSVPCLLKYVSTPYQRREIRDDASPNLAITITQRSGKHFIRRCLFDIRVGTAVLSPTHCTANPVNCYCSAIKLSCLYVLPSLYFIWNIVWLGDYKCTHRYLRIVMDYTTQSVKCENNEVVA